MAGEPVETMVGAVSGDGSSATGEGALRLEDQARVIGGYQWIERRLFGVLGGWVPSEPVAEARVAFDL